ncbi:MAG: PilN domain-containing protein [Betaproteobacteria bacterium]|nr:PilN domain-containing protein [Betaproteobacteria bacterium]
MILINLLPHREARKKRRKEAFFASVLVSALAGGLILGVGYLALQNMIDNQTARNEYIKAKNKELDNQIKDIATLKQEIDSLRARQQAVEDLQADRNLPVHLFNELVTQMPEGVYLKDIKQTGQVVAMTGYAQSQERVSDLLRNTGNNSAWLEKPELVEIKAANVQLSNKETKRLFEFTMKVSLKRPREKEPAKEPGKAASAPAKA